KGSIESSVAVDFIKSAVCDPPQETVLQTSVAIHAKQLHILFLGTDKLFRFKETESHWLWNWERNEWVVPDDRDLITEAEFSALNPHVKVNGNTIIIECTVSACFKEVSSGEASKDIATKRYSFCSDDIAKRIAKAISLLIETAGGKPSPF